MSSHHVILPFSKCWKLQVTQILVNENKHFELAMFSRCLFWVNGCIQWLHISMAYVLCDFKKLLKKLRHDGKKGWLRRGQMKRELIL